MISVVLALMLAGGATAARPSVSRFVITLPEDWRDAESMTLVLRDVAVPRNRSAIFQVLVADEAGQETLLGSFAVVAISPDAEGQSHHEAFRVNMKRPLSRWGKENPRTSVLRLRVTPIDSKRQVIENLDWSAGDVAIEVRKSGRSELYRPTIPCGGSPGF